MKWAFLVSGIVEIIGGVILCLYPHWVFSGEGHIAYNMYGVLAIAVGILNILFFRFHDDSKLFRLLGVTMMFFHGAIAIMTYKVPAVMMPLHTAATFTHLGLFMIFVFGYLGGVKGDVKG